MPAANALDAINSNAPARIPILNLIVLLLLGCTTSSRGLASDGAAGGRDDVGPAVPIHGWTRASARCPSRGEKLHARSVRYKRRPPSRRGRSVFAHVNQS